MDRIKNNIQFVILLAVGFIGLILFRIIPYNSLTGPATFIWMTTFLLTLCLNRDRKHITVTGIVFVLGFILKHWAMLGNIWLTAAVFLMAGLIWFEVLNCSAHFIDRYKTIFTISVLPVSWSVFYLGATFIRYPSVARFDIMFADMKILIMSERILGSYGFSFVVLLFSALICYVITKKKPIYLIVNAVILVLLTVSSLTSENKTAKDRMLTVAYTTGPYAGDSFNCTDTKYETNIISLKKSIQTAAAQDAKILVFNEEAFWLEDTNYADFIETVSEEAKDNNIYVLVGIETEDTDNSLEGKSENMLALIDNKGNIIGTYYKKKLIPFIEADYVEGDGNIMSHTLNIDGNEIKISCLICYDSNFPGYVGKIDDDTDILLLPSWDWESVTEPHALVARTISVENNVTVLKPTYDGKSVAIDANGDIFHESYTEYEGYETVHIVDMPY